MICIWYSSTTRCLISASSSPPSWPPAWRWRGLAEDGLTMLISTHQLRFARQVADRVVFLSGGAIIEEGLAEDVLTRPHHLLTARFLDVMGAHQATELPA